MTDRETKDLMQHWKPAGPTADFSGRLMAEYRKRFGRVRPQRRLFWTIAAASLAAGVGIAVWTIQPQQRDFRIDQPVGQPRLVVVSQGELP